MKCKLLSLLLLTTVAQRIYTENAQCPNLIEVKSIAQLDELKAQNKPMMIDVYAPWCGPCKMVMPWIAELAQEYPNVLFVKINGDKFQEFVSQNKIRGYPHFLFYDSSGALVDNISGAPANKEPFKFMLNRISGGAAGGKMMPERMPVKKEKMHEKPMMDKQEIMPEIKEKKEMMKPAKMKPTTVTIETQGQFTTEIIESKKPVIIQFTDKDCAICEKLETFIDKLSTDPHYKDVKFVRMHIENKKLKNIMPKKGGILILPDYQMITMKDLARKDDLEIEMKVKEVIMHAHQIPMVMPQRETASAMPKIYSKDYKKNRMY